MRGMIATVSVVCVLAATAHTQSKTPAVQGFERLKALEGEWIDVDGVFGAKGAVAVIYKVTGAGHTVVETFPVKTANEMVTVYHLDGNDVALTHYCSGGTQPRMRSKGLEGNTLTFDFAGGTNIHPAITSHMRRAKFEFVSTDELRATWHNWKNGKADHSATFRLVRKH